MSRSAGDQQQQQQHIAFDFTVPSQENDYHHHPMSLDSQPYISPHVTPLRRKRSASSREEDEDEDEGGDEDDEDEYMPESAGGARGNARYYAGELGYQRGAGAGAGGGFDAAPAPAAHGRTPSMQSVTVLRSSRPVGPDGQPPPKKKRRRQALSCTECKRRKIRCDRAHPCAPCTRRGEGDKCKWNILEPVEKFVTRKEYDEIKDSLSRLENILTTTSPNGGQGGASGSATDEVAAAVNIVKKQAGFLSKVISDSPAATARSSRGQSISYGNAATAAASSPSHAHSRNHLGSGGDNGNGSFAYQPFSLNVPSQSGGGLSDGGDDEYYGGGGGAAQRNTISSHSHSTSTDFSRPPSSTFPTHHLQPAQISGGGHFQSNIQPNTFSAASYASRIPEINLGGLVVEDQSHSSSPHRAHADLYKSSHVDQADSLSTLANLANASSMASSSRRSSTGHLQPGHHPSNSNMGLTSPSLTLAPIGSQDIPRPASLSISTASGMALPPSVAPPRLVSGGSTGREAQLQHVLQTSVPRREICNRLVEYYFEKVEWSITLLHRASFMRAYETFWFLSEEERARIVSPSTPTSATSWGAGFRASFLPPTSSDFPVGSKAHGSNARGKGSDDRGVNPAWISLFLALLCASLERLGFWDAKSIGIVDTVDEYKTQCRNLYDGSQTAMILGDFLKARALETIQALVLHLHCPQTLTATQWESQIGATLSVAVRLGMLMGLNKLSAEKVGSNQRPGLLKRELGRRAWWNLVERDWTLSPRVGHTYAVNPAQNFCDLPANMEWEELVFRRSAFKQQQRESWTGASFLLARVDIARRNRELTDQYNSGEGVSYTLLLKHEMLLEETISRAPPQLLNVDGDFELSTPQGQWNRFQFTFHAHYNVIVIHRPYLVAALLDVKAQELRQANSQSSSSAPHRHQTSYLKSLETSVRSAEAILDTMEEAISSQYPGVQWWQTVICCYTAAVVLLIERWYRSEAKAGTLESEDADERRRKVQAASALLREQCDAVDLFAQAANALDSLLDATTSARRKARKSGRRGMDINDVVNPVNVSSRASVASGNTPPFVREWIDRPSTPMPGSEPLSHTAPSLSTMSLFPGTPLLAETSYDSQFWARIFDLEFEAPPDMVDLFFPSEDQEVEDAAMGGDGGLFLGMDTTPDAAGNAGTGSLGGSAVWGAVSGPIGSSSGGQGWARVSPYGNAGGNLGGT